MRDVTSRGSLARDLHTPSGKNLRKANASCATSKSQMPPGSATTEAGRRRPTNTSYKNGQAKNGQLLVLLSKHVPECANFGPIDLHRPKTWHGTHIYETFFIRVLAFILKPDFLGAAPCLEARSGELCSDVLPPSGPDTSAAASADAFGCQVACPRTSPFPATGAPGDGIFSRRGFFFTEHG